MGYDAARRAAQAAGFDNIGERYDQAFPHKDGQIAAGEWLIGQLRERTDDGPALDGGHVLDAGRVLDGGHVLDAGRVLDAGCGTGVPTARQLLEAGISVTGIDISPVMLELARRNVPKAELRLADVTEVGDELGSFDGVTAFFSLLMLPRKDIPDALGQLRSLLVPGGLLALGMVEADLDDAPIDFLGMPVRVTGYPRDRLTDIVTAAGFEVLQLIDRSYAPPAPEVPPETQLFLYCRRADG